MTAIIQYLLNRHQPGVAGLIPTAGPAGLLRIPNRHYNTKEAVAHLFVLMCSPHREHHSAQDHQKKIS